MYYYKIGYIKDGKKESTILAHKKKLNYTTFEDVLFKSVEETIEYRIHVLKRIINCKFAELYNMLLNMLIERKGFVKVKKSKKKVEQVWFFQGGSYVLNRNKYDFNSNIDLRSYLKSKGY